MSKRKYTTHPESDSSSSESEDQSSSSESETNASESETSSSDEIKPTRVTSKSSKKSGAKLGASSKRSASASSSKRSKEASDSDTKSQGSSILQPTPGLLFKTHLISSIPASSHANDILYRLNQGVTCNQIVNSLRTLFTENEIDKVLFASLESSLRSVQSTKELSCHTVSTPRQCSHPFKISGNSLYKHAITGKAFPSFQCNEGSCCKSTYKVNARKGLDDIISNYKITNTPDEIKAIRDLIDGTKLEEFGSEKVTSKFPDGCTRKVSLDTLRVRIFKYVPTTTVTKDTAIKGLLDARLKFDLPQAVKDSIVAQINQTKVEDFSKLKFLIPAPSNYCCGIVLEISGAQLYAEEKNPIKLNCLCTTGKIKSLWIERLNTFEKDLEIGLITSIDTIHDAILSQPTDFLNHTEIDFTHNTCGHQSSFRLETLYRELVKDIIPECHICNPRLVVSKIVQNLNFLCEQLSIPLDSDHVKKAVDTIKESVAPRNEVVKIFDICGCELSISCFKLYQKPSHKVYKSIITKRCNCSIPDAIKKNIARFSKSDLIEFKTSQLVEIINCLNSLVYVREF